MGDVVDPLLELLGVRQLVVQQEIGHFEVAGLLGELFDRVAAVAQDAGVTIEVGDRRSARRRGEEGGVVDAQVGVKLAERRRREGAVVDRDRDLLARPVVRDRDGVGHRVPFRSS